MEMLLITRMAKRRPADVLVIPFWKDIHNHVKIATELDKELYANLSLVLESGDFKAKEGECVYLYLQNYPEKRAVLLGLGEHNNISAETLRRSYGALVQSCIAKQLSSLNLLTPTIASKNQHNFLSGIADGLLLSNYVFNAYKSIASEDKNDENLSKKLLKSIAWFGISKEIFGIVLEATLVANGVYYARDLVNGNADEITPQYLVNCAKKIAKEHSHIQTTVFDKKRITKEKMELLLAVSRGAAIDPAFIIMEYRGNPHLEDHTVIIGKGVTYDTGGLNLKPTGSMETMKCDMAGAAACFGIILAVSQLSLKVNLTVVIPSTENSIDAHSFKPGDVYSSYSGKTVEMTNSDAEGRLILADALAYAVEKLQPTRLIDLATLTGAIEIALGSEASGLMSTDDILAKELLKAGEITYERLWRMPLYEEYKDKLKSDIADIKSWNGRSAGSNVAATFLRYFVKSSIPWAHIDIASTAYLTDAKKYQPKYATGVGVRLMVQFLKQQIS